MGRAVNGRGPSGGLASTDGGRGIEAPEFVVRVVGEPTPRPVAFEELKGLQDQMQSLTLLWTTNSYHVDRRNRYFLINGGRRITVDKFRTCRDLRVYYRKRHRQTLSVEGQESTHMLTYVLGFEGEVNGEIVVAYVEISPSGEQWVWRDPK